MGLGLFLFQGGRSPNPGVVALIGVLILLAVVVTIILRQILIIALVIVSPLAMAAALLPNTEKLFRTWWSYLSKALVMYPLIVGLFAAGKIGGAILSSSAVGGAGVGDTAIKSMMSFVAGIIPLMLIPSTFKIAGGALAGVYGAMRGAAGKAYNAMMGDARDPNSIRGNRNRKMRINRSKLGVSATRALGGTSALHGRMYERNKKRGKGRQKPSQKRINRAGWVDSKLGFTERLAEAQAERDKLTGPYA